MVNFTAEEKGFIIEADGKKLRVSYDEFKGSHEDAMEFCKKQGGGDETVENLLFIARHKGRINEELKKLGKELIFGLYWSNKITSWSGGCAFIVSTITGGVYGEGRSYITYARAVKGL